jgi:hypothetical protein
MGMAEGCFFQLHSLSFRRQPLWGATVSWPRLWYMCVTSDCHSLCRTSTPVQSFHYVSPSQSCMLELKLRAAERPKREREGACTHMLFDSGTPLTLSTSESLVHPPGMLTQIFLDKHVFSNILTSSIVVAVVAVFFFSFFFLLPIIVPRERNTLP